MTHLDTPESPDVLTAGHWVRHGLTHHWQPTRQPPPANVRTLRPADLIACPTCRARLTQRCTRLDGTPASQPHETRLVTRRCPCGAPVHPRAHQCPTCRAQDDAAATQHTTTHEEQTA